MKRERKTHFHQYYFDSVGKNKTGVTTCGIHYNTHNILNKILYGPTKVTTNRSEVTCKSCLRIITPKKSTK